MDTSLDENIRKNETKKQIFKKWSYNFNTKLTSIYSAAEIALDFYNTFLITKDQDLLEDIFNCLKIICEGSKELTNNVKEYFSEDDNNHLEKM